MTRIVLDTDVVSYHRAGRLPAGHTRLVAANPHCIAFATAGELWKGAQVKRWGGVRRDGLDLWLHEETILPASLRVARIWGTITAAAQRRGRPRPLNDSWIAACCIESGLPLLTLNRRDFADFADHDGLVCSARSGAWRPQQVRPVQPVSRPVQRFVGGGGAGCRSR